jgi:hypothetical protein
MKRILRKISVTGAAASGFYAAVSIYFIYQGTWASHDPKSVYLFLSLPLELPWIFVHALGLDFLINGLSWFWAYVFLWLPTLLTLYGMGWLVDRINTKRESTAAYRSAEDNRANDYR